MNLEKHHVRVALFTLSIVFATMSTAAEVSPSGPTASPGVYKLLTENDQWHVIEGTWQPGQEDNFHSHSGDRVSLYITDCELRLTKPDGTYRDASPKAGSAKARTGKSVTAHKVRNTGDKVCVIKIVELKQ